MADEVIKRDGFTNPVGAGVTNDANKDIRMLRIDPATNRLLVDIGTSVTIGGVVEVNLDKDNDEVLVYGSTAAGDASAGGPAAATRTPIPLTAAGAAVKVDGSATTQPISGAVAQGTAAALAAAWPMKITDGTSPVNVGPGNTLQVIQTVVGVAQPVTVAQLPAALVTGRLDVNVGAIAAALAAGDNLIGRVKISDGTNLALVTAGGLLRVESNPTGTQTVSGTVIGNQGTPAVVANAWPTKLVDSAGVNVAAISLAGALKVDGSGVTQPVSGTVTANIGTTGGLALDATLTARLPAALTAGGGVKVGLVDALPTGTNTIGVVTGAAGAALGLDATLLGIKTGTDKIPASPAQEHATAASPHAVRLTDGVAFYAAPTAAQLPSVLVTGRLDVNVGAIAAALATGANTIGAVTAPGAAALALDASVLSRLADATFTTRTPAALDADGGFKTHEQRAATGAAPAAQSVTVAAVIFAANAARKSAVIQNLGAGDLFLGFETGTAVTTATGIKVASGATWIEETYTGQITGVSSATSDVRKSERTT